MITAFYIFPLALILIFLSVKVIGIRRSKLIGLGDGGDPDLLKACRAHGHFIEYVPFLVIIMALLEMSDCSHLALHVYGGALVFSRIAHAVGLFQSAGATWGRFIGMMTTFLLLFFGATGLLVLNVI